VGQLHRTRAAPFSRKWLAYNFVVTNTLSFGEWPEACSAIRKNFDSNQN
jgi:hypothetical protein